LAKHTRRLLAYGLILTVAIAAPFVFNSPFLRDLLVLMLIFIMLTLSLDMLISGAGLLTFGHQTFFAIGGYASALLAQKLGVTPLVGLLAGFVFAGLAGSIIGFIALRVLRAVYLAITTLGLSLILHWFMMSNDAWKMGIGGVYGIVDLPSVVIKIPLLPEIVFKSEITYYYLSLFIVLLIIYVITSWQRSRFGRAAAALRENEPLAKSVGVPPLLILTMVFALSSGLAGLAGAVYAHYIHAVNPQMFLTDYMLIMFVCLFLGGPGTIGGPILGAIIYAFVIQILPVSQPTRLIIMGGALLIFILFMPKGIYPALRTGVENITRRLGINPEKTRQEAPK